MAYYRTYKTFYSKISPYSSLLLKNEYLCGFLSSTKNNIKKALKIGKIQNIW